MNLALTFIATLTLHTARVRNRQVPSSAFNIERRLKRGESDINPYLPGLFTALRSIAVTISPMRPEPSRQPLQYVLRQHVPAGELGAISHQFEKRVLSVGADKSHVPQVDDQRPSLQSLTGASPRALKLPDPRREKLAFQHQPSSASSLKDGNLEHSLNNCRHA